MSNCKHKLLLMLLTCCRLTVSRVLYVFKQILHMALLLMHNLVKQFSLQVASMTYVTVILEIAHSSGSPSE